MALQGLGLLRTKDGWRIQESGPPPDLITAWRAGLILDRLPNVNAAAVLPAWCAAKRNPTAQEIESGSSIVSTLGEGQYREIMALEIPDRIIEEILEGQEDEFPPALYPITDELEARTISWRDEFARAGVETPQTRNGKAYFRQMILDKFFEDLLRSWAKFRNVAVDCPGMQCMRMILASIAEKDLPSKPDPIMVAQAGIRAELFIAGYIGRLLPFLEFPEKAVDILAEKEASFKRAAQWVAEVTKPEPKPFFTSRILGLSPKEDPEGYSFNKAAALLQGLASGYFPYREIAPDLAI